jgi:hypothetical protein
MADEQEASEGGLSADDIFKLIESQIAQTYDAARMQKAWENILGGPTPPKVFARALVQALSHGRYERRRPQSVTHVNVYVSGAVDPERIGHEIAKGVGAGSTN